MVCKYKMICYLRKKRHFAVYVIIYIFFLIILSTSSSLGNLPNSFFEKINSSLNLTSKTPPEEGNNVMDLILFLCSLSNFSVRLTALERYPQEVQYSMLILFSI